MNLIQGTSLAVVGLAGLASAGTDCGTLASNTVNVTANISTSTVWTADNVYNLTTQIYVLPGATLTIEAGTTVASTPTVNGSGSLAVSKGGQIFVQGTAECPVIMTSTNDTATWTGGDRRTGTWREAANEWGNLTIMGAGYISEDATPGNVPTCAATNVAQMEGLTPDFPGDTKVLYGGGDDADDSGSIEYLSVRYGGRVIGLANELNGLSLGGIGSGTTVSHVEIMNNVDDGIEIWGGRFNLDHFAVWNIGDDSLDVDQGFRGRVQFGLIVQGYSLNASQGSGVGDNICEVDGAENSDWQPVTTTTFYNLTLIGQPVDGDGATTWRDNARVQYRNCVVMDCGEKVVRFDNLDGDGALGYGHNGTLDWLTTWATPYNAVPSHPNDCPPGFYTAQFSGNLCEISDSVFFNNADYAEFNNVGANAAANNNVIEPATMPIQSITRGTPVVRGGKVMVPVTALDPRPAGDALTSVAAAPLVAGLRPAPYRGAFAPGVDTWLGDWTASYAFGFTTSTGENTGYAYCFGDGTGTACPCGTTSAPGQGCLNSTGTNGATLQGAGNASIAGDTFQLQITGVPGNKPGIVLRGKNQISGGGGNPVGEGLLCTAGQSARSKVQITSAGATTFTEFQNGVSFGSASYGAGVTANYQFWYRDTANVCNGGGFNFTNAWSVTWAN
jgi:hypothetical protein